MVTEGLGLQRTIIWVEEMGLIKEGRLLENFQPQEFQEGEERMKKIK